MRLLLPLALLPALGLLVARGEPDFVPSTSYLANSIFLDTLHRIDPCLIEEGTISGAEVPRRILRFGTLITNQGTDDYILGAVPRNRTGVIPPWWEFSTCHGHWHFLGYARYALVEYLDPATRPSPENLTIVARGHKMGFCVSDLLCSAGVQAKFTCTYQGISKDCGDIYHAMLDGQWIDLTGVNVDPTTRYSIAIIANPNRQIDEVDYSNNVGLATVVFGDLPGYNTWGTAVGPDVMGTPSETGTAGGTVAAGVPAAGAAAGAVEPGGGGAPAGGVAAAPDVIP